MEQSWFMMNLTCSDQCHGVRSHATSFSLTQKVVLYSLNLIHEFTSLFSPKVISAGLPGKAFPRKHAFVDISVFLWLRKQPPRFAQGHPKGYFQTKNFIERLKLLLKWMLIERWRRATMLSSMCQHVARLQFDCCAEKHSLCRTVMIHDGLNLTCLDQCHGVRSHGTSSLQGWRKRIVIQQSGFDP